MTEEIQLIITCVISLSALIFTIIWIKKSYSSNCKSNSMECDNCPLKESNCKKNRK